MRQALKALLSLEMTLLFALWVFTSAVIYFEFRKDDLLVHEELITDISERYYYSISNYKSGSRLFLKSIVETPENIELIKRAAVNKSEFSHSSEELVENMRSHFKNLGSFGFNSFSIVAPDMSILCRFSSDGNVNRSDRATRKSLSSAMRDRRLYYGYEEGSFERGFVFAYPIISDNRVIGSALFTVDTHTVLWFISQARHEQYAFVLEREKTRKELPVCDIVDDENGRASGFVCDRNLSETAQLRSLKSVIIDMQDEELLSGGPIVAHRFENGVFSNVVFVPVRDVFGQIVGYLAEYDSSGFFGNLLLEATVKLSIVAVMFVFLVLLFVRRRALLQELMQNRKLLRAIIDVSPMWIAAIDREGRYIIANKRHEESFKKPLGQIEGSHWSDILPQPLIDAHGRHLLRCFDGEKIDFDDTNVADGISQTAGSYTPLLDDAGNVMAAVVTVADLTEHARAQTVIQESQSKLQAIFNTVNVGINIVDSNGHFTDVNRASAELLGMQKHEYEAMGLMGGWSIYDEKMRPMPTEQFPASIAIRERHGVYGTKMCVKKPDGSYVWISVDATPIDGGGALITFYDISETKRLQDELRGINADLMLTVEHETKHRLDAEVLFGAVFESANIGITILGDDGRHLHANSYFVDMFGTDRADIIDSHFLSVIKPMQKDILIDFYKKTIEGGQKSPVLEIECKKADGSAMSAMISAALMADSAGKKLVILSVSDITKIVEAEEKQKQQEKILIQQSKLAAMGEMIGAIAHQWRQPLAAISATALNIGLKSELETITPDELAASVDTIGKQTQKMSATIDSFLNFFRPHRQKERFLLREAFDNVFSIVSAQLASRNIAVEIDSFLEYEIFGYKNELEQVVLNIMMNARDAFDDIDMQQKLIKIYITEYDWKLDIVFEDNAGGIDDAILERIFEPYFTTKEQGKGTGIGLYMSKLIVQRSFDGDIDVKNLYENGRRIGAQFVVAARKDMSQL